MNFHYKETTQGCGLIVKNQPKSPIVILEKDGGAQGSEIF